MRIPFIKHAAAATAMLLSGSAFAQQDIDLNRLEQLDKKHLFRFNGGVAANSIFYAGNGGAGRLPFTYALNGNLNINVANLVDLPLSFNLTNAGGGFSYPVKPSRFSLNPRFNKVTAHLGDITAEYSPYTLSGHQFRGAGFDYESGKALSVSVTGGQFQRAVDYDSTNPSLQPTYQRFGYGAQVKYAKNDYKFGVIVFGAKDQVGSLETALDNQGVLPQQNLVLSWTGTVIPFKNCELTGEYATSVLTRDIRDTTVVTESTKGILGNVIGAQNSTSKYHALRANLNYQYKSSTIGVSFERVDPGYRTLGAYYFNNDLQSIAVNFSQSAFKNKARISTSMGYQYDDLDGSKTGTNKRVVMSLNASYMPSTKLMATAIYSNFATFMNIKPVFQQINQVNQFQVYDSLNFLQITQNASLATTYTFSSNERIAKSANLMISLMDAQNWQAEVKQDVTSSKLFNVAAGYSIRLVPKQMTFNATFNAMMSEVAGQSNLMLGPTVMVRMLLLKKIESNFVWSYNQDRNGSLIRATVLNTRAGFAYQVGKKQYFTLDLMNQNRKRPDQTTNDMVITAGYNYRF